MPLAVSPPASSAGRIAALLVLILALAATPKSSASGVEVAPRVPFDEGAVSRVAPRVPFDETVAAVFRERCVRCHGPDEASGGLRLDDYEVLGSRR